MHQIVYYEYAHHISIAPKRQNRIPGRSRALTNGGHFNFRQKIEINHQN